MKTVNVKEITESIKKLCIEAVYNVDSNTLNKIIEAKSNEIAKTPRNILSQIIENDLLAKNELIPMCQDTGIIIVFAEIGYDIHISGDIYDAINQGVSEAYTENYFRKSVVSHPIERKNTFNNAPAIIHIKLVKGDKIKLIVAPKGAGSENMSKVKMLNPTDGIEGIKHFVIDTVKEAGGRACPPIIIGVGIGGDLEKCALMAKEALTRDILDKSNDEILANLERNLLEDINNLNIGPMGLGGKTTALAVKINSYPCHIASLPVAVNIQCHAQRHKEVIL